MNRRSFLQLTGAGTLATMLPHAYSTSAVTRKFDISAKPGKVHLVGPDFPATRIWGFNGQVPGSLIRVQHGDTLDLDVKNSLDVPTSVHWHGIRLPNTMDGVAGLTQAAISPGESFRYQFTPPDAGTYWYHSHVNAHEQIGRGLYGPLIIEEKSPPIVDREFVWMIDDWRLLDDASISNDFGNLHDLSHAGRIGNVPTVNGRFRDIVKVHTGERIRLRLINASNARNFALTFGELKPTVIAIDGQSVKAYESSDPVVIGAAGRVDLILDMTDEPGTTIPVVDSFYRQTFDLVKFVYEKEALRDSPLDSPVQLELPTLPEPDLSNAIEHEIRISGGAMGGLKQAKFNGQWMELREIAQQGYVWAINDVIGNSLKMEPLIKTTRGTSIRLKLRNQTAFPHPMHLHGHHMKLLSINEQVLSEPRWVDSPLVMPDQAMELAFVADNPGQWLFHCHALEHHAAGLGTVVDIA